MGGRRASARSAPAGKIRDKTKQKILDAAMKAIQRSGFGGATMAEIRRRSGASTGSIYHHFGSKEAIAARLYTDGMGAYHEKMRAHFRDARSTREAVEGMVAVHLDWVEANRELAGFLFATTHPDVLDAAQPRLCELNKVMFGELAAFIRERQERGELDADLDLELFIALVVAPAQHCARRWLGGEMKNTLSRAKKVLGRAAWRSVGA